MKSDIQEQSAVVSSASVEKEFQKISETIAHRVRYLLVKNGWSVEEFAEMMVEDILHVYEWVSGRNNLTLSAISKMEAILDVDLMFCEDTPVDSSYHLSAEEEDEIDRAVRYYKLTHDMTTYVERRWMSRFLLLVDFKRRNGHVDVPAQYKSYKVLGSWVYDLRKIARKGTLEPDRMDLLDLIGFRYSLVDRCDWDEMFGELINFKLNHGHLNLSDRGRNKNCDHRFYMWVMRQRRLYWEGKLEVEKLQKLKKLGVEMRHKTLNHWQEMFTELVEYKKQHGHLHVCKVLGARKELQLFVVVQRRDRATLSKERKRKLDRIGFIWDPGNDAKKISARVMSDRHWMTRYKELRAYKREFGTSYVVKRSKTHPSLGAWVCVQKNRKDLTQKQINLLKMINFFTDNKIESPDGVPSVIFGY
ncbi:hypothetical protein EYV94_20580 [Puteibacter caeruleilacunae]|nr:hypothetical protein EYV94_20580 [Puteibacter caeruleilacunae]